MNIPLTFEPPLFPRTSPLLSGRSLYGYRFTFVAFPFIAPLFLAEPFSIFLVVLPPDSDIAPHDQIIFLYKHVRAIHSSVV
jgi:hypothetical protein